MILQLILTILIGAIEILFGWLPDASTLPSVFGYSLDTAFVTAMGYWQSFSSVVWPVVFPFQCALFYMGFLLTIQVVKIFLGHRTPSATT
ncbi:MAG: hypothetical protein A3C79_00810 [Candidatus Taylorbacteria bacterium RIFCSPHIGHO2_02_FULL_45_28]|uniref:Uncharacterized protein n=1 Tax=Candidatus Taylorbacteria bacterium RIFCSPHIGHO2_12_FULL_45_16 TaxID=1802315 RepID=A0A1G2MZB9_9BACT|nr:MAG: hypothetical protein A2830_02060 [Candidatus Taylorbacteria bacterium RIFCSPHIGHO2_01_FULL_44_110]OHA25560.1 MAG: hypothetical protein A3C79_00810 [Candidatus Taylorbacteria bacterium RIFCSPHIGHO2_02_FULL_45_28]OHA29227.1 MAG: hypothetical protein A3F51_01275 [Candidatus Taylorbacteria bacterium RIFCSPHIGHO2_12_FULL_45_16]OHA33449.1 MAG: hypothetical protein A3A23_02155 [Candidatus Taylorbacteria bacterium RIFCSPLOWO2_01_FULL_45_59]OHA39221.1 MAG: hypothetical protein A3I98_02135 [Candi